MTLASIPIFVRAGSFIFGQPVVQHTGEMPGNPLIVTLFPGASSERWFYEDAGNGFEYRSGQYSRRRFSARSDAAGLTISVGSPEGSYRAPARPMIVSVRSTEASSVRIGGAAIDRVDDLDAVERGWAMKDGAVLVKFADRFEATEIRIQK